MVDRDATSIYSEFGGDRLPPGQRRTDRFPVLSKSGTPSWDMQTWEFTVTGAVDNELEFTWEEFNDLPQETQRQDFHCVTGWSRFDNKFTGVTFPTLAERASVHDDAEHVLFGSLDGYSTNLPLDQCLRDEVLFVLELEGQPLPSEHGGPLRVVTPHKYAYKGAKWVTNVTLLTDPMRGYWEMRGYSNTANPWGEERYSSL
ncbi:sulfite oxidase-like oxidoreductase [Halegenticoccus tardaugens]|uniref:sulfite oxidase-like oxidoreductase n=1 Tax=Halegenticoccus tardaugens TaxID=2071624 RepID=UPI00100B3656|nr:sulfite oxidase-like oxidoreductase [Halegenticoccus tardaugens]